MLKELTETLRSVRLELEYLSPGEVLPDGADEVLDFAVQRLRDMDREIREKEESLQEKDAMIQHQDEIIKEGDRLVDERDATIREKDSRISSLELDIERLNDTIADLEALARLLGDNEAALRGQLTAEREASSRREDTLADTETKLADVLAQTGALRAQLADKDMQIIQRDAKMAGLRGEVERLDGALAEARGHLRAARGEVVRDRVAAQNAVVAMRAQLLQALSVGEGFLGGVASEPASASSSFSAVLPKQEEQPGRGAKGGGDGCGGGSGEAKGVADLATLPAVPTGLFVTKEAGKF
jgi:chromosome segregation ATPase